MQQCPYQIEEGSLCEMQMSLDCMLRLVLQILDIKGTVLKRHINLLCIGLIDFCDKIPV